MSWFTNNSLGVISMVATGVGTLCGAVWWMSALYSEVKRINTTLSDYMSDQKAQNIRVWKAIDGLDHRVDGHEQRLTKVETRLE
tara:strand:- start:187 stop:438 length:252 start_codon:yes stop_codon:yes gene_type:complete